MNISKFVVLGTMDMLATASGYDIIRFLESKMIRQWTNVKNGSIYNAIKTLAASGDLMEFDRVKNGSFPTMTLYTITEQGQQTFDTMQAEAFLGLYPQFSGFKLALKFNQRRSPEEIKTFADKALNTIEEQMQAMDHYLTTIPSQSEQKDNDAFFMEHERLLLQAEKQWITMAVERIMLSPDQLSAQAPLSQTLTDC